MNCNQQSPNKTLKMKSLKCMKELEAYLLSVLKSLCTWRMDSGN